MYEIIFASTILLLCGSVAEVNPDRLDCGYQTTKPLYIQADRKDNNFHENKLLVSLGNDVRGSH